MSLELSLYDFPSDLRDLMEMRDQCEDDLTAKPEEAEALNAAIVQIDLALEQYYQALTKKVDDIAGAWKWLEALFGTDSKPGAIDAEIKRLQVRRDRGRKRLASIKTMVLYVMESMEWRPGKPKKLEGARAAIYLKANGGKQAVAITDEELVPDEYCSVTVTMPQTLWNKAAVFFQDDLIGTTVRPRVPSLSLIGEALLKDCGLCEGTGDNPDAGFELATAHPNITDEQHAAILRCPSCGGSGKAGVPGAALAPRGAHVECK